MRMGEFWVVLSRWICHLFVFILLFLFYCERKNGLMCSVHSEAFLQKCRAEECSITRSTLLYSSLYIITEDAGSRARLQIADRYYRAALAALYPSTFPTSHFRLNYYRCCPVRVGSCEIEVATRWRG